MIHNLDKIKIKDAVKKARKMMDKVDKSYSEANYNKEIIAERVGNSTITLTDFENVKAEVHK